MNKILVISTGWLGLILLFISSITSNTYTLGLASFLGTISGVLFLTRIQNKFTFDAGLSLFMTALSAITGDIRVVSASMLCRALFYQLSALRYYRDEKH